MSLETRAKPKLAGSGQPIRKPLGQPRKHKADHSVSCPVATARFRKGRKLPTLTLIISKTNKQAMSGPLKKRLTQTPFNNVWTLPAGYRGV